jgi:nucleotide-binding universal stress UspA family protein
MEKILAAMDPVQPHLFAGIHALNLAKRINAKVLFLLILPDKQNQSEEQVDYKKEALLKKKVEALLEEARSDGIAVDYYLAYGNYESELVSFVHENKVTLLVVESPVGGGQPRVGGGQPREAFGEFLNKLRHRINCRIEVVNQKTEIPKKKGK